MNSIQEGETPEQAILRLLLQQVHMERELDALKAEAIDLEQSYGNVKTLLENEDYPSLEQVKKEAFLLMIRKWIEWAEKMVASSYWPLNKMNAADNG